MKRRFGKKNESPVEPGGRPNPWPRRVTLLAVVAAVFAAAGGVGALVRHSNEEKLHSPTGSAGPSGLAVGVSGSASVTLILFEDMRNPATRAFQHQYGATLSQLVDAGLVKLQYREVAGEDRQAGGSGSLHAGNALACAQDAKDFPAYRKVLLADQPAVSRDVFASNAHLIKLAKHVKGLDTDVFRQCVQSGQYDVWVKTSTSDFAQQQPQLTTPVLQIARTSVDGVALAPTAVVTETLLPRAGQPLTPDELADIVTDVALGRPTASPSASPSKSTKSKKHHKGATASPSATP